MIATIYKESVEQSGNHFNMKVLAILALVAVAAALPRVSLPSVVKGLNDDLRIKFDHQVK